MQRRSFLKKIVAGGSGLVFSNALLAVEAPDHSNYELSKHIIDKTEIVEYSFRWPRLVGRNSKRDVHGQYHKGRAMRIYTSQGAVGWGMTEFDRNEKEAGIIGRKVSELIDPKNGINHLVNRRYDVALYDLAGIILNKPVYKLLGNKGNTSTNVYSGMIYLDELPAENHKGGMEVILSNCQWDYDYGYRQLKVKIGRSGKWYPHDEGLNKDIEVVNLIHERFKNKNTRLLVDANNMYTPEDVKAFLHNTKHVDLYWLEEPFHEEAEKSRSLKKWMNENGFGNIYYADGEDMPEHELCMTLLKEGTLDVMLSDTVSYGFSKWVSLLRDLKNRKILASPHAWGDRLKTNYTMHLSAGIGSIETIEGVTCLSDDIDYGNYPIVNGKLKVSNAAGFGMKLVKK